MKQLGNLATCAQPMIGHGLSKKLNHDVVPRYQTVSVPGNRCKIFAGVKTGEYPFEHWNAPPSTYNEVNTGVSTLLATQHRMGWHNWCAGEPNSGSSSSCNIFYGEKFSSDNYCWFVLIQRAISSNKPFISMLSTQG